MIDLLAWAYGAFPCSKYLVCYARSSMVLPKQLAVLFLTLCAFTCSAEILPPTFTAFKGAFSSGPVLITQSAVDSFGSTFWAGAYSERVLSFGGLSVTNRTFSEDDGFIVKMSLNLDGRWIKNAGPRSYQGVTGLAVEGTNGVYFAIRSTTNILTFDNVIYRSSSNQFTVVFKYSTSGRRIWARQANGVSADGWAKTLDIDVKGNVFLAGTLENKRSVLHKLDKNGSLLWRNAGSRVVQGFSLSIRADSIGNTYFLSSFTDRSTTYGTRSVSNNGKQNYVLVKRGPQGGVLWVRAGGGSNGEDYGVDLAVDKSGNSYVLSTITSTNAIFGNLQYSLSSPAWFLTKYNRLGQPQWAIPFATPNAFPPIGGASIGPTGNILMSATSTQSLPGEPSSAGFLSECSPNGEVLWQKRARVQDEIDWSEGSMVWSCRLISDPRNNLFVAGFRNRPGFLGFDSLAFPSDIGSFILKLQPDPIGTSVARFFIGH